MIIKPYLIKVACVASSGLCVLPIDLLHTKFLTNKPIAIKFNEIKLLFLMCNIFAIQNTIYQMTHFISNNSIRGALAGLCISPLVTYIKIKKYTSRLCLQPIYRKFIFWTITREILFYSIIYTLYNIYNLKLYAAFFSNLLLYPLKIISLNRSFPSIRISFNSIRKSILFEILEGSIGDSISLYLINRFS